MPHGVRLSCFNIVYSRAKNKFVISAQVSGLNCVTYARAIVKENAEFLLFGYARARRVLAFACMLAAS